MMRVIVGWIVGLALAANGLTMLSVPAAWYAVVPGVPPPARSTRISSATSASLILVAGALPWFAIDRAARPAALIGAAFLAIHAAVHLWDAAVGREHAHQLLVDLPPVFLPPALAIWIVWSPRSLLT